MADDPAGTLDLEREPETLEEALELAEKMPFYGEDQEAPEPQKADESEEGGGQVAVDEASAEEPAGSDKEETPPNGEGAVDLEALPEHVRHAVAGLPADVQREIADGYLRRDKFTQGTQGLAEFRRKAEAYESLWEDDEAAAALHAIQAKRRAAGAGSSNGKKEEAEDPGFDFDTATNEEFQAYMKRVREETAESVLRRIEAERKEREEKMTEAQKRERAILESVDSVFKESGLSKEAFTQAVMEAREFSQETFGVDIPQLSPEKVPGLIKRFLPQMNKPAKTSGAGRRSAVSPAGRSSLSSPPEYAWEAEGRAPQTKREELEEVARTIEQMTGRKVSPDEVEQAARSFR